MATSAQRTIRKTDKYFMGTSVRGANGYITSRELNDPD